MLPLAAPAKPFVSLWVGPDAYAGDAVCGMTVLNSLLLTFFSLWGWLFSGMGRFSRLIPYLIIQATLNLTLSLFAAWQIGLFGPLLGTAIVNLGYNAWKMPRLLQAEFGISPHALLSAVVVPLIPAVAVLIGLFAVRESWPSYSWARLASIRPGRNGISRSGVAGGARSAGTGFVPGARTHHLPPRGRLSPLTSRPS